MLELDHGAVRPEVLPDLLARNHLARLLQEKFEELQWLALETAARPSPGKHTGLKIHFEFAEAPHRWVVRMSGIG